MGTTPGTPRTCRSGRRPGTRTTTPPELPPLRPERLPHLRAAALAFVFAGLFVLATPGLDLQSNRSEYTRGEVWDIQDEHGVFAGGIARVSLKVNQAVRQPLLPVLQSFLRPIRGGESWALFTRGRGQLRWFEVRVDDEVVHRSASRKRDWRASTFRNRHVRPIVAMFVTKDENRYAGAFARWVVAMAREDFPDAHTVTLRGVESAFPKGKTREIRRVEASAPAWELP